MPTTDPDSRPECFGILDQVFPRGEDGLRQSPDVCLACERKVACLRQAVAGDGELTVEDEKIDRAYQARKISFLERWARKKSIRRRRQKRKTRGRRS